MKLRVGIARYRRKLRRALSSPRGPVTEREGLILTLATSGGAEGKGEAAPIAWIDGETLAVAERDLSRLGDTLEIADAMIGDEPARVAWSDGIGRGRCASARAAIDAAALDLVSRLAGVSSTERLGGVPGTRVPLNALIVEASADDIAAAVRDRVRRGFRVVKLKVGAASPSADLARVRAARGALGESARLRLDANAAWRFEVARDFLHTLGPDRIEYVEEPLADPTSDAMTRLRSASGVVLALDESFERLGGADGVAASRCADVVVLKPARVGGPTRAVVIGRRLAQSGVAVVLTDAIETEVGRGAVIHAAAALAADGEARAVGLGGLELLGNDVPDGGIERVGPHVAYARGPGTSVTA